MSYIAALFLGLAAMLLRIVYVFLPLAYLSDVLVFAALGMLAGYLWPRHARVSFFLLVGPTYLFLILIVVGFDWEHVLRGVGIVHVVALVTIPAAAWLGITGVARSRLRAGDGSESAPGTPADTSGAGDQRQVESDGNSAGQ